MGKKKPSIALPLNALKVPSLKMNLPVISVAALGLTLLLVLASGYWSYDQWITQEEQQRLQQYSQLQAEQRAADVQRYLDEQQQRLDLLASRTALVTGALAADPAMSASLRQSLHSAFPQALAFKLFTPDRQERLKQPPADEAPATAVPQPLTFTELDMINRAQQGQPVPAEVLRINNRWHLHLVTSIGQGENTADTESQSSLPALGTLLVTLPAQELFDRIQAYEPELGQTQLQRDNSGRPLVIYRTSNTRTDSVDAGPAATRPLNDDQWRLSFTPSPQLAARAAENPQPLLLAHLLVGGLLLGLVFWITGKVDPQRQARPSVPAARPRRRSSRAEMNDQVAAAELEEHDILDLYVAEEDRDLLGLHGSDHNGSSHNNSSHNHTAHSSTASGNGTTPAAISLPDEIFRAYDIRGVAHTQVSTDLARRVGQVVASEAIAAGESSIFVARDGRTHSPELCTALIEGILSTGCHVINLGAVPTPLMNFATFELPGSRSGVMVTASHNPAEYNGFKMVINGRTLVDTDVQRLKQRILDDDVFRGQGSESSQPVVPQYIDRILSDVALAGSVKLVIDAGNGITGEVAPLLFEELGCEVETLFCDIDGRFPNHDPDPTIEANLQDLIRTVQATGADLGVSFDGDGDRLVLVTPSGQIIWPDRLLMLFAKDIVARNPGADVLFDVKCTRELNSLVSSYGGRPIMWKAGHSNMKSKMQETGALVGGEMSGHIFIKDRWYGFDDGMYAAARLLEIMTLRDQDIDSLFASFPSLPSTPEIKIPVSEERKFELVDTLIQHGDFQNGKPITIDGLRVDFSKGWGLVRASNTSAALTLRFEAETEEILAQLQQLFKTELLKIDSSLDIPF